MPAPADNLRLYLTDALGHGTSINGLLDWLQSVNPAGIHFASVAPTVDDDEADGYEQGSLWADTVAHKVYVCQDPAAGNADWMELGSGGGSLPAYTTPYRPLRQNVDADGAEWAEYPVLPRPPRSIPNLQDNGSFEQWVDNYGTPAPADWGSGQDSGYPARVPGRPGSIGHVAVEVAQSGAEYPYLYLYSYGASISELTTYTVTFWYRSTGDCTFTIYNQNWNTLASETLPGTDGEWTWYALEVTTDSGDYGLIVEWYEGTSYGTLVLAVDDVQVTEGTGRYDYEPSVYDAPVAIPGMSTQNDGDAPLWDATLGIWVPGPAGGVYDGDISVLDIDGGTDIGAALADADLIVVDDGGAGTNRKAAMSRVKTYINALTDPGSPEQGDVLYQAAAALARLAHGTAGQVLVTGGHAANPAWGSADAAIKRIVTIQVIADATTLTTGDGKAYLFIPSDLNGWNLVDADACVTTVGTGATLTAIQLRNVTDSQDMLSTKITLDASEKTSFTAATQPVINTTYDDVATGDQIAIDVDAIANTTAPKGLSIILVFQKP